MNTPNDKKSELARVREVIRTNREAGRGTYDGLDSSEIGMHSRAIMFGDADEAFPARDEWSRVVD